MPFFPGQASWCWVIALKIIQPGCRCTAPQKTVAANGCRPVIAFRGTAFHQYLWWSQLPWAVTTRGAVYTVLSFINITNTLHHSCILRDNWRRHALFSTDWKSTKPVYVHHECLRQVPMLYYILHFYLIHILVVLFLPAGIWQQGYCKPQCALSFQAARIFDLIYGVYMRYGFLWCWCYTRFVKNITGIRARTISGGWVICERWEVNVNGE